jgi:hypothetical protein
MRFWILALLHSVVCSCGGVESAIDASTATDSGPEAGLDVYLPPVWCFLTAGIVDAGFQPTEAGESWLSHCEAGQICGATNRSKSGLFYGCCTPTQFPPTPEANPHCYCSIYSGCPDF